MQRVAGDEVGGRHLGQERARRQCGGVCGVVHQRLQLRRGAPLRHTAVERGADRGGQHGVGLQGLQRLGKRAHKAVTCRIGRHQDHTGAGAELACTQADRPGQRGGQRGAVLGNGCRQHHQRVDRTQLAVKRNRARTFTCNTRQRRAALERTGERHRGDLGRLHQRHTHFDRATFHKLEHTCGQALRSNNCMRQCCRVERQRRVCRVALHDHRAASGQRRRGVPAQHRKRKRKVAGREHGDRAQWHPHTRQVRAAHRWSPCDSFIVDGGVDVATLQHVGKTAQLEGGAVQLTIQARQAQASFAVGQRDDRFAVSLQRRRQGAQQGRSFGRRACGKVACHSRCGVCGTVDVGQGRFGPGVADGLAGAGFDGLQHGEVFQGVGARVAVPCAGCTTRPCKDRTGVPITGSQRQLMQARGDGGFQRRQVLRTPQHQVA